MTSILKQIYFRKLLQDESPNQLRITFFIFIKFFNSKEKIFIRFANSRTRHRIAVNPISGINLRGTQERPVQSSVDDLLIFWPDFRRIADYCVVLVKKDSQLYKVISPKITMLGNHLYLFKEKDCKVFEDLFIEIDDIDDPMQKRLQSYCILVEYLPDVANMLFAGLIEEDSLFDSFNFLWEKLSTDKLFCGRSLCSIAAERGRLDIISKLISINPKICNLKDVSGENFFSVLSDGGIFNFSNEALRDEALKIKNLLLKDLTNQDAWKDLCEMRELEPRLAKPRNKTSSAPPTNEIEKNAPTSSVPSSSGVENVKIVEDRVDFPVEGD